MEVINPAGNCTRNDKSHGNAISHAGAYGGLNGYSGGFNRFGSDGLGGNIGGGYQQGYPQGYQQQPYQGGGFY